MTSDHLAAALTALPDGPAFADDLHEAGYREDVIEAIVTFVEHAPSLILLFVRSKQLEGNRFKPEWDFWRAAIREVEAR